jgi:hypothetical protein
MNEGMAKRNESQTTDDGQERSPSRKADGLPAKKNRGLSKKKDGSHGFRGKSEETKPVAGHDEVPKMWPQ